MVYLSLQGVNQLFLSVLVLMSALYHGMERRLKSAENTIKELKALLQKRNENLQTLVTTINGLQEMTEENERRLEMQRNQLKEQYTVLREMLLAMRMKGSRFSHVYLKSGTNPGEISQEFWVLRKHRGNLITVTKPYIRQVIKMALEAGLISENVGKCATKCPTLGHNCADEFYKALQVRVGEAPHALKQFLLLIQQRLKDSQPCQRLCSMILEEIQF